MVCTGKAKGWLWLEGVSREEITSDKLRNVLEDSSDHKGHHDPGLVDRDHMRQP